jgi:predicted nucleic acid-binding protein
VTAFLDTNILVYAFSQDRRAERARALMPSGVVGIQSLNEFANVALRKLGMDWRELRAALDMIEELCVLDGVIDRKLHRHGLEIAERYRLSVYDAMIVAAALRAGCDILWSEDMQDKLVIENALTVRNPFAKG